MAKKNTKSLALKLDKKGMMSELQKEINEEYKEKVKDKVKQKMKEIRMLEITLEKAKNELDALLDGKKQYNEEELLFN